MNRDSLVSKLTTTGHLNVAERQQVGTLTRAEIHDSVTQSLRQNDIFPPTAGTEDGSIYEGVCLVHSDGVCSAIIQRHHPNSPGTLAESTEKRFSNISDAVEWYIANEWRGEIDGITIET